MTKRLAVLFALALALVVAFAAPASAQSLMDEDECLVKKTAKSPATWESCGLVYTDEGELRAGWCDAEEPENAPDDYEGPIVPCSSDEAILPGEPSPLQPDDDDPNIEPNPDGSLPAGMCWFDVDYGDGVEREIARCNEADKPKTDDNSKQTEKNPKPTTPNSTAKPSTPAKPTAKTFRSKKATKASKGWSCKRGKTMSPYKLKGTKDTPRCFDDKDKIELKAAGYKRVHEYKR